MEFHLDAHFSLMTIMSYTAYQGEALCVCVCGWWAGTLPAHVRYNATASLGANKGRIEPENSLRNANYRVVSLKSPHYFTGRIAMLLDGYIRVMRRRWQYVIAAKGTIS